MVSSKLKKRFEEVVTSGVKPLISLGITPNMVTVAGLVASLLAAWFYSLGSQGSNILIAGLLVLFSGLLDAIDGVVARVSGKVTVFGGFFDSVSDRYSDALVLAGVTVSGLCNIYAGVAAIIGSLMVSYARAKSESSGIAMASIGIAERAERMILLAIFSFIALYNLEFLGYGIIILGILANFTVLQRVLYFKNKVA
ncbi:CDP-alcohol phosphatidyltransferase family protein [Candidatus Bathyarchaeota archaeon]|nr:CDP-alcohol phosphatidyltransferase family protein [Candidatus Bathyarchaeota archaeon]